MKITGSSFRLQFLIALVAALLFIPGLGAVHIFDWDEINFAEITREMLVTGDWLQPRIDYLPFHEKPPLFIWFQAISMSVFGVNEFAARLPNALCGIVTLLVLFRIGTRLKNETFGALWALAYIGSILPHLYFRSGIIDPWFNLFIFLGLDQFIQLVSADRKKSSQHAILSGLFLGLAVMTKGPVGVLIPGLSIVIFWVLNKFRPIVLWRSILIGSLVVLATISAWAVIDYAKNGPDFMIGFFWRQVAMLTTEDAGHGGFFGYHVVVLVIGCFPASLFALQEMNGGRRATDVPAAANTYRKWMLILFWVVLILFSLVKTKIVHYSSLCYFPLTYLAALQLERSWVERIAFGSVRWAIGILGALFASIIFAVPILGQHIELLKPLFAQDQFALANLDADVQWDLIACSAGLFLFVVLVVSHVLHKQEKYRASILTTFCGTALFVWLTLFFFINNIEGYSQRAAIEFFQARQDEKCYVITRNYKSYAQLFYTRKPLVTNALSYTDNWLLTGDVDRPVYVVCKVTSAEEVAAEPMLNELYRKNGFVFFVRQADQY
ncbi:MAG: glycosyltransferase family 39 protein [Flavobacteriales bacterium]|nr:glycosyltransferase family 39 protein [Flavobacteriales bacterium]